jgi:hypothetical protein
VCDLETSRIGAPYIYDISHLRVEQTLSGSRKSNRGLSKSVPLFLCNKTIFWRIPLRKNTKRFMFKWPTR